MLRFSLALLLAASSAVAAPITLSHSGFLLGSDEVPVTSEDLPATFRLVDASDAQVWSSAGCSVDVKRGYYAIVLGAECNGSPALDTAHLPASEPRFLEVTIGTTTLLPRARIVPAPAAVDSLSLGGAAAASYARLDVPATFAKDVTVSAPFGFIGKGSGLTDLAASQITVGQIADTQLASGSVLVKTTGAQTIGGDKTFSGGVSFGGAVGIGTASPQRALHVVDVMRLEPRSSFPASPAAGDLFVHTNGQMYVHLGSWRAFRLSSIDDTSLPTGITSANVLNRVRFNGNANDDGTLSAGTSVSGALTYAPGVLGDAAWYFGATNAVALTRSTLSSYTASGFTAAAWVKGTDTNASTGDYRVANNVFGDTHSSVWMGAGVSSGKAAVKGQSVEHRSSANVADGSWHHLAFVFTWNGTTSTWSVQNYVDGVADGGGALPTTGNSNYGINAIGRTHSSYPQYYGYAIDQALVFSKALSASQVMELRNFGL